MTRHILNVHLVREKGMTVAETDLGTADDKQMEKYQKEALTNKKCAEPLSETEISLCKIYRNGVDENAEEKKRVW